MNVNGTLRCIHEIMIKGGLFVLVLTMNIRLKLLLRDCCEFVKQGLLLASFGVCLQLMS